MMAFPRASLVIPEHRWGLIVSDLVIRPYAFVSYWVPCCDANQLANHCVVTLSLLFRPFTETIPARYIAAVSGLIVPISLPEWLSQIRWGVPLSWRLHFGRGDYLLHRLDPCHPHILFNFFIMIYLSCVLRLWQIRAVQRWNLCMLFCCALYRRCSLSTSSCLIFVRLFSFIYLFFDILARLLLLIVLAFLYHIFWLLSPDFLQIDHLRLNCLLLHGWVNHENLALIPG